MSRSLAAATLSLLLTVPPLAIAEDAPASTDATADAATDAPATPEDEAPMSAEQKAYFDQLRKLQWVKGPTTVDTAGNSRLTIPEGYVFLDAKNTDKFLALNENLASGQEVMVAPESLEWSAYLSFEDEGYVKDDEKIDAPALLKTLQEGTESSNAERRSRGWPEMHLIDWAVAPAYNRETKRLEWATLLESGGSRSANFSTKILGRRGYTTVILAASPDTLTEAEAALNEVLGGYSFNSGDTYAEWRPGDKVAEYGLAALVVGGAAALATKKGLWGVIAGFLAAAWKFIAAAGIALLASLRKMFGRKQ